MKKIITILVLVGLVGFSWYLLRNTPQDIPKEPVDTTPVVDDSTASTTDAVAEDKTKTIIGSSVEGRDIVAYHFGEGDTDLLFVGGIHGGYEWNTALVAYEMIDYLKATPTAIPANVRVTVIPVLNPDGLYKVTNKEGVFLASDVNSSKDIQVSGRFNANKVDLNRNFDCDWNTTAKWQNTTVSGGSSVFSEPESMAMKAYIEKEAPAAVVIWYSAAGGVFSSNCHNGVLPETTKLTSVYAKASGYPAYESYDYYETTGDMANWLAKLKIPAISVLLTTHDSTEWAKNQKGIDAFLQSYSK